MPVRLREGLRVEEIDGEAVVLDREGTVIAHNRHILSGGIFTESPLLERVTPEGLTDVAQAEADPQHFLHELTSRRSGR